MKKQIKSSFRTKFHLLNSQENTNADEIIWSSNDSSDYENVSHTSEINVKRRKRKRPAKRKMGNQVSSLNISFIESVKKDSELKDYEKLHGNTRTNRLSPILNTTQFYITNSNKSPVLPMQTHSKNSSSPIIPLKNTPLKRESRVKKKLFSNKIQLDVTKEISKILGDSSENSSLTKKHDIDRHSNNGKCLQRLTNENHRSIDNVDVLEDKKYIHTSKLEFEQTDNVSESKTSNKELIKRIKSYFSNDFTSESSSQHSNIEYESTPQNSLKTSDDIITTLTQDYSDKPPMPICSFENTKKGKKIRYKKDGLAYRLSCLLKKHNANISLWQHERFLAANSNFIIPKGEFKGFRILNVHFKYGLYLLDCKDFNNENVLICINNVYVNNNNFQIDMILKLYVPFRTIIMNTKKLIVNVSKFECKKV